MSYIIEDCLLIKILGWSGNDLTDFLDEFPLEKYEEKRTCRMEYREGKDKPFCSNCGEEMDAYTCEWTEPMEYSYPFCYACGAKVMD